MSQNIDPVSAEPQWWLAVPLVLWANPVDLIASDPQWWAAHLQAAGVGELVGHRAQDHLHVLLPSPLRGPVRAWIGRRGLTLTSDPARMLQDLPVFVAQREVL